MGAIAGAELTIRTDLGIEPVGRMGLAVRSVAASHFERVRADVERVLGMAAQDLGSRTWLKADEYGFLWAVVADPDFPDLVAAGQIVAQMISEEGFRDQLLCAVFPFSGGSVGNLHFIYSFKRGSFYAFAPRTGMQRDTSLELRAHALLERELPLESKLEYRYPLWGIPLDEDRRS